MAGLLFWGMLTFAGRNPPNVRAARRCLWASALLLCEMDIVWRINTQQTWWVRLLVGIAIWGTAGAGIPEGLRWIARRQTNARAVRNQPAPAPPAATTPGVKTPPPLPASSAVRDEVGEVRGESPLLNPRDLPPVLPGDIAQEPAKETRPNGPALDIVLTPEKVDPNAPVSHVPGLTLAIENHGSSPIADVTMRVTEYQLDARTVTPIEVQRAVHGVRITPERFEDYIYSSHQYHEEVLSVARISPGERSPAYNLAAIKPFRFAKYRRPGDPYEGGRSVPLNESDSMRFYALRISFLNGGDRGRYTTYKVICSEHPYLVPSDGPDANTGAHWGRWTSGFTAPFRLIVAHQRQLYASAPGIEYTSAPQSASESPRSNR
jgi:hypothetical protein